jgi:hypothetical protein
MTNRIPLALSFTAGLAVCAAATVLLDRSGQELNAPAPAKTGRPWEAMPCSREHVAVLNWIFEHRPGATQFELFTWSGPSQVADNPFSHSPATLVKLVVKDTASERLEQLSFYLCNLEVLGSVSQPYSNLKTAVCA